MDPDIAKRRYLAFSKCQFDKSITEAEKTAFMKTLLPYEKNLAATQFCIGAVEDAKYHYRLELTNHTPIKSKPMPLNPE